MGMTRPGGLLVLLGVWLAVTVLQVQAADPALTPASVTDTYGNSADQNGTISWASIPAGSAYKTDITYDDGGLGPMFAFARSFINTAMRGSFPFDIITGLAKGTFDIGAEYMTIVNYAVGFAVCLVIGFLYMFIMPIVGCCFCCFRCCCGACGGNMKRRRKDTDNCYRIAYTIVLAIATLFVFVGCLCVYVTNGRVATSMTALQTTINTNLDDMQLYLDNTVNEITYLTSTNFNFTTSVINRDLDNIGYLLGVPVRDELNTKAGVHGAINAIMALDSNIQSSGSKLVAIDSSITTLKSSSATLTSELADAKSDVDSGKGSCSTTECNALDSSLVAMQVDFNNLPDISANVATMNAVLGKNLTAMALDGKNQFDNIPDTVTTDTATVRTDIKALLASFSGTITNAVSSITSLPAQVGAPLADLKVSLGNTWSQVTPYDTYRFAGGVALACIVLLVVILQFVGVGLGVCGYDDSKEAHERSTISHVGGQLLMAASGFIFIFSSLLMLLTVILFLVGGIFEKAICQPLSDPTYAIFNTLIDSPTGLFGSSSFLGQTLLQDGSIELKFADVLTGCEANGGAFTVLKLSSKFNLSTITNYKSSIDIQSQIDAINVDLTTIDLISTQTENQLNDFASAVNIPYSTFATVLSQNTVKTDLTTYAASLRTAAGSTSGAAAASFNSAAGKLDTIIAGSYQTTSTQQATLKTDVATLETEVAGVPTAVSTAINNGKSVESFIGVNGTALIKTEAATYGTRILGSADSFATYALNQVTNYVGGCRPLYDVYNSIFLIGLCKYIVDVMNGFWFSLGWVLFFETISVIFDIKLAKFLRRMKVPEDDELETIGTELKSTEKSPPIGNNKVAPADEW